jgi:hypothetical protein
MWDKSGMSGRVQTYNEFLQTNKEALSLLLSLKDSRFDTQGSNAIESLNKVTGKMIGLVDELTGDEHEDSHFWQTYNPKEIIDALRERRSDIFGSDRMLKDRRLISIVDDADCDPAIKTEVRSRIAEKLNEHNSKLDGEFDLRKVKIKAVRTPHDLIRYSHRLANLVFFDPDAAKWETGLAPYQKERDHLSFYFVSGGSTPAKEIVRDDAFLSRLVKIINSGKFRHSNNDDIISFKALEYGGNLSMQLDLGYHYASLTIEREGTGDDKRTKISLGYVDTDCETSSEFRADLAHNILKRLGLNIKRKDNALRASGVYKDEREALDVYEMILRFSVSVRDVDLLDKGIVEGRLEEACNAFFSGVLDINNYFNSQERNTYIDFAKAQKGYLDPKKAYKNIPSLRDFKCHPEPKKKEKSSE